MLDAKSDEYSKVVCVPVVGLSCSVSVVGDLSDDEIWYKAVC